MPEAPEEGLRGPSPRGAAHGGESPVGSVDFNTVGLP